MYRKALQSLFISALIVSHGREIVGNAIESVLNQDLEKDSYELIVVADQKLDSLKRYERDSRLKLVYSDSRDPGGKWAEAISLAKGDVVSFLDDDDEWVPHKLKTVRDKFVSDPLLGYYHNCHISIDYNGRILHDFPELRHYYAMEKIGSYTVFANRGKDLNLQYLSSLGAPFNSSCISMRKDLLDPYLETLKVGKWMVDYFWFYVFGISDTRILLEKNPLTLYRRRDDETGDQLNNIKNSRRQKITIYSRYLQSHTVYRRLSVDLPFESYFNWIILKIELILSIYEKKNPVGSRFSSFYNLYRNIPRGDLNSILSSLLIALGSLMACASKSIALMFVQSLEILKLSLV